MKFKVRQALALILLIFLVGPRPAAGQSGEVEAGQDFTTATVERILDTAVRESDNRVRVIVKLADESLATYSGGVSGLRATSLAATGASKLTITEAANVAYLDHLTRQQETFVQDLARQVPSATVDYRYQIVFNGLAMAVHPKEVAGLLKLPGVKQIYPDHLVYGALDGSLDVVKAPAMWAELGGRSQAGEGIFVAVIDSGIDPENPMFSGAGFQMPPSFPKGFCATQPDHPHFQCNSKLVAARFYNPPSGFHPQEVALPLDINGHGSHVAGIAAGNPLTFNTLRYESPDNSISGVAPGAYLMVYKALFHMADPERPDGVGLGSSLIAALNDAVADGADVINNSWGSLPKPNDPWEAFYAELIANITQAGVLTVFSAGNNGPDWGTLTCPGCVEEALTVANSSTDRLYIETLDVIGPQPVPARLRNLGVQPGTGPSLPTALTGSLKYAGAVDPANSEGCQPFPANAFQQSLAIIRRGTCPYLTKVTHAAQAGASAVIVFDSSTRPPIIMTELEATTIPAVMMSQNDGQALVDWVTAHPTALGQLNGTISRAVNPTWVDFMARDSSAGPNLNAPVIKPDITAPGMSILSAYSPYNPDNPGQIFEIKDGTSMAAPHVTGAAALMMQLHPDWTPHQVKTALTSTSVQTLKEQDSATTPATPFRTGAGRLDLERAGRAGLTFDKPSHANPACAGRCAWTYLVESVLDVPSTWTVTATGPEGMPLNVTPTTFTLGQGETQQLTITADVSGLDQDQWYFGEVVLRPNLARTVEAHLPFALQPTEAATPAVQIYLPVVIND